MNFASTYLYFSRQFFVSVDEYTPDKKWQDLLFELLGSDWSVTRWSYWVTANCNNSGTPTQGFKLHISPCYNRLVDQLQTVARLAKVYRCSFKVVADTKILELMNSKYFSRVNSGKFITIYPRSVDDFLSLGRRLASEMSGLSGPYILTDRRVPNSTCVYYRYGGFARNTVRLHDDTIVSAIKNSQGNWVEDKRLPYFFLPDGISDPFLVPIRTEKRIKHTLNGKYHIESAITLTNGGGIYVGYDFTLNQKVIIKEARPHAGVRPNTDLRLDSVSALQGESEILDELRAVDGVVKKIAFFKRWENWFLVEPFIEARTWQAYFANDDIMLCPFMPGETNVKPFLKAIVPAIKQLIDVIQHVHACDVAIGDLSPSNILIDASAKVWLIDMESASHISDKHPLSWKDQWVTPGFGATQDRCLRDWLAVVSCVADAAIPIARLASVKDMSVERLAEIVTARCGLPSQFEDLLVAIGSGRIDDAERAIAYFEDMFDNHGGVIQEPYTSVYKLAALRAQCETAYKIVNDEYLDLIADHIEQTFRNDTPNFFWPSDSSVFETNNLNICFGAAGVARYLKIIGRPVPEPVRSILSSSSLVGLVQQRGLYTGLAGLLADQCLDGNFEAAARQVHSLDLTPDNNKECGVFSGAAGIGITALCIYAGTGSADALGVAHSAFRRLCDMAQYDEKTGYTYWLSEVNEYVGGPRAKRRAKGVNPNQIAYGYAEGLAGIAFFLGQYSVVADNPVAEHLARKAIDLLFDNGRSMDRKGRGQWGVDQMDERYMPYWFEGAAGIGSVLCRLGRLFHDNTYMDLAVDLCDSAFITASVNVGQVAGLSGVLEFMTDMYLLTHEARFKVKCQEVIAGIVAFATKSSYGIAFPGHFCLRFATDFATGSAGVGLALHRAIHGGPRDYMDFCLPTANLFDGPEKGNVNHSAPLLSDSLSRDAATVLS